MGHDEEEDLLSHWLSADRIAALDAILSHASDIIGVVDRHCTIRYINWAASGLSRDQVIGLSVFRLTPPGYAEIARAAFEKVFASGDASGFETIVRIDGEVRIWTVNIGPVRNGDEVIGAVTINTEVTDKRRESVDRDRFFSLSRDVLAVITPEGHLKRINPEFGLVLGYDLREVPGKHVRDFVHPEDFSATLKHLTAVQEGEGVDDLEARYRTGDGAFRLLSWKAAFDPITESVYAVGRDVTDQRTMELRLRHASKMEAVGQLAGGIAHDFNNLMQAVLANVELALALNSLPPQLVDHLKDIDEAGRRAAELTKQLLLFSKRRPLVKKPLDLNEIVREIMKLVQRLLPKDIVIELSLKPELPSVNADRTQLEQVIMNLCVNARDAMERGGRLTLETNETSLDDQDCQLHPWATAGRFVQLSVSDTGSGMSAEVLERVFEPFFTTKENQRGTGLGLATVHGIIEQHGGLVHVYSEVGEGTTFKLYLPTDDQPVSIRPQAAPMAEPVGFPATILVAEDDERVRRPLLKLLEKAGYTTISASDGHEAVRLLREHVDEVDLVLLDLVMPDLSGAEAVAQMLALRPELPVLFASGYADERSRERLPEGAEILEKPFRARELLVRIRQKLEST